MTPPTCRMRALCAAEEAGLLTRGGNHFFPMPRQGVAAPGGERGPAPDQQPPPLVAEELS